MTSNTPNEVPGPGALPAIAADEHLLRVLHDWVGKGIGPLGELTFREVAALADFALSRQQPLLAKSLIQEWKDASEQDDWDDANANGDADVWLALTAHSSGATPPAAGHTPPEHDA